MNHAGEITPLTQMVRPHVAIITTVEPVHLEYFGSLEKIADAKAEIFAGLEPGGVAVLNRDNGQYRRGSPPPPRRPASPALSRFGEHADADARLTKMRLHAGMLLRACRRFSARTSPTSSARPAGIWCMNSLGVLAAVSLAGGDLALAALALNNLKPATGRGARATLTVPGGSALLIDESYNANPASMAAALALLGQATVGAAGRRIAVLGDMLELGDAGGGTARARWRSRSRPPASILCIAPVRRCSALWEALPSGRRGGYAVTAAELEPAVLDAIRAGDAVMVKGSLGSKMGPIVKALERQYPRSAVPEQATTTGT